MKKFAISFIVFLMLLLPAFSFVEAESQGLIPCGRTPGPTVDAATTHPCGFNDIMALINKVIKFILFDLALPIAAIMFFYAGFKLVTSGGSTEAKSQAKNIFTNTVFGIVIAAGSWLIIRTILKILGYDGDWIGF